MFIVVRVHFFEKSHCQGYRVLAMAVLPISAGTLRYGSSDGGKQGLQTRKRKSCNF
jgi:hypothetical protein